MHIGDVPPDIPVYPHVDVDKVKFPFPPLDVCKTEVRIHNV